MRFSPLFVAGLSFSAATAYNPRQSSEDRLSLHQRPRNVSTLLSNGHQKRDDRKYVFMHHIVGNTYHHTLDDWKDDIRQISAKGVDAIALNIGGDDWQMTQVGNAYAAAQALGSSTKLFFSFDFTTNLGCSLDNIVWRTRQFSSHLWQFRFNGKPFISSFSGDCLGNAGWQSLKDQTGAYLMPFVWGLEGKFNTWPSLDSWQCWGCAWPQGNYDKNTDDDYAYIKELGTKYAATVSNWFYTNLPLYSKNRLLRSDDWLLNNRWEQLMGMRSTVQFVEIATWNDWGESSYFGSVGIDQPAGTTYADGFPHVAWYDMSEYYIQAFKTGSYPVINQDVIYYWARPHPANAVVSGDTRPDGWDWTQDYLWAAAFCSSSCTVTLKCGSSTYTFVNQPAGVNKLKIALAAGQISVSMIKNGQTVISKTDPDFKYALNPTRYNYNAFVGAAYASVSTPGTTTTTTTTATTTAATATSTSVAGVSWKYLGCYPDPNSPRTLNNGISTSTDTNSVSTCLTTCKNAGYVYAGVEYERECWCAKTITAGVSATAAGDCSMKCSSGTGICGGGNRINIYFASAGLSTSTATTTTSTTSTTTSSAPTSTPSWSSLGCFVDTTNPRTLNNGIHYTSQTGMTVASCLATCAGAGYLYGGTEYGVFST
ncbi:glycosyl hydrolase family 71-domain-containing protein [Mycena crocata]|nr:glycosyl hydrolase family 71-domain-containing protein [Mycena crocata]